MLDQSQDKKKLQKKAKRKYLNFPVIKKLIALDSPLKLRYCSTLYCSSTIKTHDGKTSSRYCKRPWCNICNPIRVAIRLNNYSAELEKLGALQLTTLTLPNCSADGIKPTFDRFRKVFRQFRDTYKAREKKLFCGVYNLECTIRYNEETKKFHPHIHIIHEALPYKIIPGKEWKAQVKGGQSSGTNLKYVNTLIEYWLKRNPQATLAGQDCRVCTSLIEGFKYTNKSIFKIKLNGKNETVIPVSDLDSIYQSLAGVRCFQPFGIKKCTKEEDEQFDEMEAYTVAEKPDGIYKWIKHDWYHKVDSTPLSDYVPNEKDKSFYDTLDKNKHYKQQTSSAHTTKVCNLKTIRRLHGPEETEQHPTALQRLLTQRRQESEISQTNKSGYKKH